VIVTDADIAAGNLMTALRQISIVFSLASEAIGDGEIQRLRDYVNAGGFLLLARLPSPGIQMARHAVISPWRAK